MSETTKLKTRFAPTPSGFLHIGNAFSFVVTALLAKLSGAEILLRIDDLDRQRYKPEYVENIFRTLDFLKLEWELGPQGPSEFEAKYSQQYRLNLYHNFLEELKSKGLVFACQCSRRELQQNELKYYTGTCIESKLNLNETNAVWRAYLKQERVELKRFGRTPKHYTVPKEMQYSIVKRRDGIPAYQIASVVDDMHFGVNLIVRGKGLFDSSLFQLSLANEMCLQAYLSNSYLHHPLLIDEEGGKLSKSQNERSLLELTKSRKDVYRLFAIYLGVPFSIDNFNDLYSYFKEEELLPYCKPT